MSEKTTKSADEVSHKDVAEQVITPKRKYFFPDYGKTVEVEDTGDTVHDLKVATNLVEKEVKAEKENN